MLTAAGSWRHVRDHGRLAVACEGVLEDLGELAASERRVLLLEIKRSDALFESQE